MLFCGISATRNRRARISEGCSLACSFDQPYPLSLNRYYSKHKQNAEAEAGVMSSYNALWE